MSAQRSLSGGKQTWGGLLLSVAIDPERTLRRGVWSPLFALSRSPSHRKVLGFDKDEAFLRGLK
jgi:hypothetical protein